MKNWSKLSVPVDAPSSPKICLQSPHQSLALSKGRKGCHFVSHLLITCSSINGQGRHWCDEVGGTWERWRVPKEDLGIYLSLPSPQSSGKDSYSSVFGHRMSQQACWGHGAQISHHSYLCSKVVWQNRKVTEARIRWGNAAGSEVLSEEKSNLLKIASMCRKLNRQPGPLMGHPSELNVQDDLGQAKGSMRAPCYWKIDANWSKICKKSDKFPHQKSAHISSV